MSSPMRVLPLKTAALCCFPKGAHSQLLFIPTF